MRKFNHLSLVANDLYYGRETLTERITKVVEEMREREAKQSESPLFDQVQKSETPFNTNSLFIERHCKPIETLYRRKLEEICKVGDGQEVDADLQVSKMYDLAREMLEYRLPEDFDKN